jgi:hypothetical protein
MELERKGERRVSWGCLHVIPANAGISARLDAAVVEGTLLSLGV